jgi:hypothetical protein
MHNLNRTVKTKFKHIISLGHFCSVASELERFGLRDSSDPFDWVICDIQTVTSLLKNNFDNLFDLELLSKNKLYPYIVQHQDFKFDFYHDFHPEIDLKQQISVVASKYRKRINRFYSRIEEPTLFIRYIENNEIDFWYNDAHEMLGLLKSFNPENSIILIINDDVSIDVSRINSSVQQVFFVKKDQNDSISREFLRYNKNISSYLNHISYPRLKRIKNYVSYCNKRIPKLSSKIFKKIRTLIVD